MCGWQGASQPRRGQRHPPAAVALLTTAGGQGAEGECASNVVNRERRSHQTVQFCHDPALQLNSTKTCSTAEGTGKNGVSRDPNTAAAAARRAVTKQQGCQPSTRGSGS